MSPPSLTKSVRINAMLPPPKPQRIPGSGRTPSIPGTAPPMPPISENPGGPVSLSTIQNATGGGSVGQPSAYDRSGATSPVSSRSRTTSVSSRSSNPYQYHRQPSIASSRALSGTTFSTMSPSNIGRESMFSARSSLFPKTVSSRASSARRSRGSRLRNEVIMSPEDTYVDLFPRTRIRLANLAYHQPDKFDQDNLTPDQLRVRMLNIVFGWDDDIEPLIRDEISYHKPGSTSAVLLSKWLGDVDSDMMASMISTGSLNQSDWMVLALTQMNSGGQMGKMGQAFVQRLLQQGDFHTSATILLGMGDREDAIEVYVSRSFFMEAILLTTLLFPDDWQRQAHLVRKWGEFVVENSQQQLAIRCFSCTGMDPPMPWPSPSLASQSTPSHAPSAISSLLSPPLSPPVPPPANPNRMTNKAAALKVITSFGAHADKPQYKFPGLRGDDRTPTQGPGITPIADTAISPGGTPGGFHSSRGHGKTATPGGFLRPRLPSIGENPLDVTLPASQRPSALPTPDNSGSDKEREPEQSLQGKTANEAAPLLLSSARYDPTAAKSPLTAFPDDRLQDDIQTAVLPNPSMQSLNALANASNRSRNGSRDRKPSGLQVNVPENQIRTHQRMSSGSESNRLDHRRAHNVPALQSEKLLPMRDQLLSDGKSPPLTGSSWASSTKSPAYPGRSIDQYISSLDEAGARSRQQKTSSRRRDHSRGSASTRGDYRMRSKPGTRETSPDRGRNEQKYVRPGKRSPSSPVPMSPEDIELYRGANNFSVESFSQASVRSEAESRYGRDPVSHSRGIAKLRSGSKASDFSTRTVRRISPDGYEDSRMGSEASCGYSKESSRQQSPSPWMDLSGRGRSKSKNDGSVARSPSSPLPMSPQAQFYEGSDGDEDDGAMRIVEANRQRLRSRHRSSSRKPRERSSRRDMSTDRRRRHGSRHRGRDHGDDFPEPRSAIEPRRSSGETWASEMRSRDKAPKSARQQLAQKELQARRESLARNPKAPQIVHPTNLRPSASRSHTDMTDSPTSWGDSRQEAAPIIFAELENNRSASAVPFGLPATPRAMRHPRYDTKDDSNIPAVPEIPDGVEQLTETYYTGQPIRELPRSMSAPIPEPPVNVPMGLPSHPAFHKGLKPNSKRNNLSPLGEIGAHRRKQSLDSSQMPNGGGSGVTAGIDATIASGIEIVNDEEPPVMLPELQHLLANNNNNQNNNAALPPPPPPPPAPFSNDSSAHASVSSGSGVGVISIAIDDDNPNHIIDVPPPPPPPPAHPAHPAQQQQQQQQQSMRPPPLPHAPPAAPSSNNINGGSSTARSSSNHRRGRSVNDNLKNGIRGFGERLRSSSRGRNGHKSPEAMMPPPHHGGGGGGGTAAGMNGMSGGGGGGGGQAMGGERGRPYESVPTLYF